MALSQPLTWLFPSVPDSGGKASPFLVVFLCGMCNFTSASLGLQISSPSSNAAKHSRRPYMSMHDVSASRLPPFAPNEFVCRWLYHRKFSPPEDECHRGRYDLDTTSLVRHEHLQGYMLLIGSQLGVVLIHCGSRNIAEKKNIPHLPSKTFMASIGTTQEPEADPCAFSKLTGLTGRSGAQTTTDTVTCPQMKTQPHRWNAITTPTA